MDEPNYNITDSSGTIVGQIGVNANGDPVVSKPGGGSVVVTDDGVEIPGDASVGGSFSTDNLSLEPIQQITTSMSPGETKAGLGNIAADTSDDLIVTAMPLELTDSQAYDTGFSTFGNKLRVRLTETQNGSGGPWDVKILVFKLR